MSMVPKKHFKQTPINNLMFKLMTDDNFSFLLNKYLLVVMIISESFKTRKYPRPPTSPHTWSHMQKRGIIFNSELNTAFPLNEKSN